eukprot:CAMPEP_0178895390 /NCGR_PEP_ID=MMETSP0786-20121207/561_1 /TAXON_ID=186022 /ORGANISM="Thalassionema frauenfeldii, Strain CCMP 1798" /LENGTH=344 /DNA_ID=CAMNT_0020565617 /DNA_START=127 /DNA_END=1161 /DNA_ORIENTATION=+
MKLSTPVLVLLHLVNFSTARLEGSKDRHRHELWQERIVGGSAASRNEYPYFVSWGGCGASLIAPDVILSAAHCNGISSDNVIVGAYQRWWGQASGSAERRKITERRAHPQYSSYTLNNDFLVMKLDKPITTLEPVKLNDKAEVPEEEAALTVIGFGSVFQGGWGPRLLQEVDVLHVPHDQCNAEYDGDIYEDVMLCAGVEGGGKDSCQGDSGGPIVEKTSEGHVQVGVVSWGRGCAQPGYSGVYSRISGAKEWINEMICDLSDTKPSFCFESAPATENVVDAKQKYVLEDCTESLTGLFDTDSPYGYQDCDWLKENIGQYRYLCNYRKVATTCPVTCDACDDKL